MGSLRSFEELECWKQARILRIFVKDKMIPLFPEYEQYALKSQVRKSSRSVGDNIAEGYGRFNFQENIQFCRISRGSLEETLNHGLTAFDEKYISEDVLLELRKIHSKNLLILNGYIKYLKNQKKIK